MACGILVPEPGIKLMTPAQERENLNHWASREVPHSFFEQTFYQALFLLQVQFWVVE